MTTREAEEALAAGWALMPRELTIQMLAAVVPCVRAPSPAGQLFKPTNDELREIYCDLQRASPTSPVPPPAPDIRALLVEVRGYGDMKRASGAIGAAEMCDKVVAALSATPAPLRESLMPRRDHLTVTGTFQSDKYPWCPAGFVPLKVGDPMARDLLAAYALRRGEIDAAFRDDLIEALANADRAEEIADG